RGLDEIDNIPSQVIQHRVSSIALFSPKQRRYQFPFTGFSVNREALDQHLAHLAERAGAEIETGVLVRKVVGEEVVTDSGRYRSRVIVGADGPKSIVARYANLNTPHDLYLALTAQVDGDFRDPVKMYFGSLAPGGYAWVIPKGGCANVGLGTWSRYEGIKLRELFDDFVSQKEFAPYSVTGGFIPASGPVRRTVAGKVLTVGDAAGHVMATNGGGVNLAMICGRIAGECIAATLLRNEPLENYEERWREVVGKPLAIALRTKKLADRFLGSDFWLEFSMKLLGSRRMARAIRCKRIFRR
ncbi:MAG: NAD(P)/FAD-dependent oxidoreductase, partial [Thermoplasmata archaeon]